MAIAEKSSGELGGEEKIIALKILLVIYLYQKRYLDALADIEELLNDPDMQIHLEYLYSKQAQIVELLRVHQMKLDHAFR